MSESVITGLALGRSEFTRRLTAVAAGQWTGATPCSEWNVRTLVNHVVGQEYRLARNMAGGSVDEYVATRDDDYLGAEPVAAWETGIQVLDAAIDGLPSLDTGIEWRIPIPARELLGFRVFEDAVHTWDLSRAIGFDEQLDRQLVDIALGAFERMRTIPAFSTFFDDPKSTVDPEVHPQTRLLFLAGRSV